jgi:hypothetical protein
MYEPLLSYLGDPVLLEPGDVDDPVRVRAKVIEGAVSAAIDKEIASGR